MSATLLLTQRFPPHSGAAARRLAWVTRRFAERGAVYVIRSGEPDGELSEVTKTINIKGKDLRGATGTAGKTVSAKAKANPLVGQLLKMRQAFPFVYLTDDGGADYRQKAFAAACELIEAHDITTIFSSFRPWSDHLIAAAVKREFPCIRWIADFRDLPVDRVRRDVWWPALQRWWGPRIVAGADEVWAVSEGQGKQLTGWHNNIKVRRNPLLALPPEGNNPVTERFTIVYTGSLYAGLQTVAPLVGILRELLAEGAIDPAKLQLIYRGKDEALFRRWTLTLPEECLDIQPSVAPAVAQHLQREAQVLLLLNWSAPGYYGVLTAKLWDYLATGRPVLALVNGPGDEELKGIVEGAAAGAVFGQEERGLKAWLLRNYSLWMKQKGTLPSVINRTALEKYLETTHEF